MQMRLSRGLCLLVVGSIIGHARALSIPSQVQSKSGGKPAHWSLLHVIEQKARSWFPDATVEEGTRTVMHPKKPGAGNAADVVKEVVTPSPGFFKPLLSLIFGIVCLAAVWAWNAASLKAARNVV
mmetsp:Transcript_27249/g.50019  ORF Transcript_27249/g.50019 Transcript_27249/m.50019 type:complete len:125 (-) Transcript_27249:63-437(-)